MRPPGRRRRLRTRSPALGAVVRSGASVALAAAIAVPLLRRRHRIPAPVTLAAVTSGPLALAVLRPRSRGRDVALYVLQMWAFTIAHEIPFDDPERLRRRLRTRYPIVTDRLLGGGQLPTVRLQRAFSTPGTVTALDRFLSLAHWAWFLEPHLTLLFVQRRHTARFPRAARQMAAVYDLGCTIYWAVPTAPPWWAAEQGLLDEPLERISAEVADQPAPSHSAVRRVMIDVGEGFWGRAWDPLYDSLGGNPWAAMPSLHFATSLLAALLLAEIGPAAGVVGWGYSLTLGFALVYLGEHYVTDLIAGAALVYAVRRGEPIAEPLVTAVNRRLQRLERIAAHG